MDLDIKGEIGHLGYVIKLTLVIHKVIHRTRDSVTNTTKKYVKYA
jgi:hypothetical protein